MYTMNESKVVCPISEAAFPKTWLVHTCISKAVRCTLLKSCLTKYCCYTTAIWSTRLLHGLFWLLVLSMPPQPQDPFHPSSVSWDLPALPRILCIVYCLGTTSFLTTIGMMGFCTPKSVINHCWLVSQCWEQTLLRKAIFFHQGESQFTSTWYPTLYMYHVHCCMYM